MPKIYAEVSEEGIRISGKNIDSFIPLPRGLFDRPEEFDIGSLPKFKSPFPFYSVTVLANMRRTVIRIGGEIPKKKNSDEWDLVVNNFPIGSKMNENTHVFDGEVFFNNNSTLVVHMDGEEGEFIDIRKYCFIMAALPMGIADAITRIAVSVFGNLYRISSIDAVENILFRVYSLETVRPVLVAVPQGGSLRLLHISNGMPVNSQSISNHIYLRENELNLIFKGFDEIPEKIFFINPEYKEEWGWFISYAEDAGADLEYVEHTISKFLSH